MQFPDYREFSRLAQHATLVPVAKAVAADLLAIPFTALRHTKRQIDAAFDGDPAAHLETMLAAQEDCLRSPEHAAVMRAYREAQAHRAARG